MKYKVKIIQLNLSTTATFGTEESGHCREVAVCRGSTLSRRTFKGHLLQGAKKVIFTACHLGKVKLAFTSPNIISTSPQNVLMSRIDFTVLLSVKFLKIAR